LHAASGDSPDAGACMEARPGVLSLKQEDVRRAKTSMSETQATAYSAVISASDSEFSREFVQICPTFELLARVAAPTHPDPADDTIPSHFDITRGYKFSCLASPPLSRM